MINFNRRFNTVRQLTNVMNRQTKMMYLVKKKELKLIAFIEITPH